MPSKKSFLLLLCIFYYVKVGHSFCLTLYYGSHNCWCLAYIGYNRHKPLWPPLYNVASYDHNRVPTRIYPRFTLNLLLIYPRFTQNKGLFVVLPHLCFTENLPKIYSAYSKPTQSFFNTFQFTQVRISYINIWLNSGWNVSRSSI